MQIDEEFKRFKQIREELNLTQSAFADELGISATTADIERGRTRIPGQVVKELLRKYSINPLWLFGDSKQKYLQPDKLLMSPKVVTVDNAGKDNIVLVSAKAAAGYPNNIGDAQWFETLPAFSIPLPEFRNATFRGFQVEGDSMLPVLHSGEWIVGKALDDWEDVNPKQIYVVVTVDSILVKKIQQESQSTFINLISSNPEYSPIKLDRSEIKEIWIVNSKLTFDLEADNKQVSLLTLHSEMRELKEEMRKLVKDVVSK
ncbi:XRE family transcriptional regulator [Dyadobacter chenhuakuii]|uniref:LexA family transcriptional regulator n=1 Tax=Dyadobacter chenhuakuii TaxID=2909339 RepID=A0A9X1U0R4_9BACT|nr:LexA family transcriptional regulator [Dyadobacter chenhuakuii]MCF2492122.1 LexA family transcriptional regulator [Dyadobacter chenhuakuii]MCF2498521.1 LexA family transcriptional regulator [Dyadobacter chenhuakuii]USJ28719.1 LexA family transcriptional regulator [Dyadobacter chenhuakuii]